MHLGFSLRKLLGVIVSIGLLAVLACGPSEEEASPTTPDQPAAPTATPTAALQVPQITVPTPTATPVPPAPGVTAAPQPTNTPTPVPEGGGPVYGGTTAIGQDGVGDGHLDPAGNLAGYGWGSLGLMGSTWSQLLRFSVADKQTVELDLAEAWSVDDDGTTYRFTIRDDVFDHEGNRFTAEDAAYQLYRYIERPNSLSSKRQGCLRQYVGDIEDDMGATVPVPGVEAVSDTELIVRTKSPAVAFVACFVSPWTGMMPDTYTKPIDESGTYRDIDFGAGEAVGTGPFVLTEVEAADRMTFERNSNYFMSEYPYLDGFQIFAIPDANTRVAAFLAGSVDYLGLFGDAPSPRDVERIVARLGEDAIKQPRVNANGWRGFPLNTQKPPFGPVGDPTADKLRTAIQWMADRNEFNQLAFNGTGHLSTPYFIGWDWIHTADEWLAQYKGLDSTPDVKARDLADAQDIMTELGYSESNPLEVQFVCAIGNRRDCEVFDQQLERIWINADLQLAPDWGSADNAGERGDFQIIQISKGLSFQDPDGYSVSTYLLWEEGGRNYSGWVNPEWRDLMNQQSFIRDQAERAEILRQMSRIFWDDAHMIGMVRPGVIGLHRSTWQNWTPPIVHTDSYSLERVWLSDDMM